MIDFVFTMRENKEKDNIRRFWCCEKYARFLKQPLTLGMFVPCDESGNVLKNPLADDNDAGTDVEYKQIKYNIYKERVLFERFEIIHKDKVRITIQSEFTQLDYNILNGVFDNYTNIEELTRLSLLLTTYALKQIGL